MSKEIEALEKDLVLLVKDTIASTLCVVCVLVANKIGVKCIKPENSMDAARIIGIPEWYK